jgi:LuxR family maltose regulon positive regulatory protein
VRFLTYLVSSLGQSNLFSDNKLFKGLPSSIGEGLDWSSSNLAPFEPLLGDILQELANLQPFTILVLDDYHLITNPVIHAAVEFLLQNLPSPDLYAPPSDKGCHPVIISRSNPPFFLARWRLRGEFAEIGVDDLRLSLEESAHILNQILHLDLSMENVVALKSLTEGWVAGLQLAAMSIKGQKDRSHDQFIRQFKGSDRLITDYLIEEVLLQQPPEIQAFLLQTSILDRMCSELCSAVTLEPTSQAILESLERNNSFVVPLDNKRKWYRYHQLFADALVNHLKAFHQDQYQELHSRAAVWLEEHENLEDSLRHWLAAEKYERAAQLVANNASTYLSLGYFYLVRGLVESFPTWCFQHWPWLSIYRAWAYFGTQPEAVETWLTLAERVIQRSGVRETNDKLETDEMLGNIATIRSIHAARSGDLQAARSSAPEALQLLPADNDSVRGLALSALGMVYYLEGQLDQALDTFTEARSILQRGGNYGGAADSICLIGNIHVIQGRLHTGAKTYQDAIALDKQQSQAEVYFSCCSYSGLGEIQYEWNQLPLALANLQRGHEMSERMGYPEHVTASLVLAKVFLRLGELEAAENILKEFYALIGTHALPPWVESQLVACWLHFLAVGGDSKGVERLALDRGLTSKGFENQVREPEGKAYALACYLQGELNTAVNLASVLEQSMFADGRTGYQIRMLTLLAASLKRLNESNLAQMTAARAISLGAREGYLRCFVELGDPMLELITGLARNSKVAELDLDPVYLRKVISAFLPPTSGRTSSQPIRLYAPRQKDGLPEILIESLTPRQMKVLRLMVGELSNQEIAQELDISLNTVKTHIANIYKKLDVHSRLQAANRAKQLGLL